LVVLTTTVLIISASGLIVASTVARLICAALMTAFKEIKHMSAAGGSCEPGYDKMGIKRHAKR
jgi:hypothetical protein